MQMDFLHFFSLLPKLGCIDDIWNVYIFIINEKRRSYGCYIGG